RNEARARWSSTRKPTACSRPRRTSARRLPPPRSSRARDPLSCRGRSPCWSSTPEQVGVLLKGVATTPDGDEQRRNGEQSDRRGKRESADHGEGERSLQLAPRPDAEGEGEQAEQGAQRRHQNRAEAHTRGLPDRDLERYVRGLHPEPREIEQDDPVLDDQPDQQDQAHERRDV